MKKHSHATIKLLISFIISGSLIFAGTSLLRYIDPTFSIGLFDLLAQVNLTAWLLLALMTGMIFGGLSLLPVFSPLKAPADAETGVTDQLSD